MTDNLKEEKKPFTDIKVTEKKEEPVLADESSQKEQEESGFDESLKQPKSEEIDDYTARMDRMVDNLQTQKENYHKRALKIKLICFAAGTLIIILFIYLMIKTYGTSGGFAFFS